MVIKNITTPISAKLKTREHELVTTEKIEARGSP